MKRHLYPKNWEAISLRVRKKAGFRCERCKSQSITGRILTVHHLDGNQKNNLAWNLTALCQVCHLHIQAKVKMRQGFFEELIPVSEWFKPHLEGYYNWLRKFRNIQIKNREEIKKIFKNDPGVIVRPI